MSLFSDMGFADEIYGFLNSAPINPPSGPPGAPWTRTTSFFFELHAEDWTDLPGHRLPAMLDEYIFLGAGTVTVNYDTRGFVTATAQYTFGSTVVPEPCTGILFLVAAGIVLTARRRKTHAA